MRTSCPGFNFIFNSDPYLIFFTNIRSIFFCILANNYVIFRWGLGRTDTPRPKSARGIMEWASVVEEVLDMLNVEHCAVMAHSAGAPYALSFANRAPDRIRGDICLLAPWVGGSDSSAFSCHFSQSKSITFCRWVQVAQVCPQRDLAHSPSCRMESAGLDDWQATYALLRRYRV